MDSILFVTNEEIVKFTQLTGNFDVDKLTPFIKIAQDIEVQGVLGTALYDKISDDIDNNVLAGDYLTLVTNKIQPMLIQFAMADLQQFHGYEVSNAGIVRNNPENTVLPDKDEIDSLVARQRQIADGYRTQLIDHLCLHNNLYPEYNAAQDDGTYPNSNPNNYTGGWNL